MRVKGSKFGTKANMVNAVGARGGKKERHSEIYIVTRIGPLFSAASGLLPRYHRKIREASQRAKSLACCFFLQPRVRLVPRLR